MRIQSLSLLSFLLLAMYVLLVEGDKRRKQTSTPGKPKKRHRSQTHEHLPHGKFATQDLAECRWAVTELTEGSATLKVACTQKDKEFSCYFGGNLDSCLQSVKKTKALWKQLGQSLKGQNICENPKSVVRARMCRKKFPEASLKLLNSTLIKERKPSQDMKPEVEEATRASPVKTQTVTTKGPECVEDPEIATQSKVALDYCGESWADTCKFFLRMFQDKSC
ncbi:fibroblast growth factor-binding protein 1 [Choloepus didactylus]|uniref:fibroblast growth factor-binding protein 1 n=1 Tax=Choloepus didactylus TaxID=27675 RepID=UPI0018A09995|nr:fibroblast growth factor-binding protein 1 [Choloepus didactylus]